MIVGDRRRFAIEFDLDEGKILDGHLGEWLFGHIRFWCGGEQVGTYEETTIRDVATEAERFLAHSAQRRDESLFVSSQEEIVRRISRALYEDYGQSDAQVRLDAQRFRPFVVSPEVDVFDRWRIYLVEGERAGRLMWQRKPDGEMRECALAKGEFDGVLKGFLVALSQAARVVGR